MELLLTVPGLGVLLATVVALEIDRIERFVRPSKLVSYAGLVPTTYSSGGRTSHGSLIKMSNMAWHARPVLVVRAAPRRYCLPVPFSCMTAYYGQPIDGVHATRDDCRCALEALERRMSVAAEAERSRFS